MKSRMFSVICLMTVLSIHIGKTQMVTTLAQEGSNITDALVMDAAGNLYGSYFNTAYNGAAVYKMTPGGDISVFADGFSSCNGLDFDSQGNLYVVDFTASPGSHQVYRLDANGEKTAFGPVISGASGILFHPENDTLYVSQYNSNRISKLAPDGTVSVFVDDSNLNGPVGMAFDAENNLYVANFNDGEIYRVSENGDELTLIADLPNSSFWGVGFITYASGYIYATGIGVHKIFKVSLDGEVIEYAGAGVAGVLDGPADIAQFNKPNGITTNPGQDTIYISGWDSQAVRMITETPNSLEEFSFEESKNPFQLYQNSPNPFVESTSINYSLGRPMDVTFEVLTLDNRIVKSITKYNQATGDHEFSLNKEHLSAGTYLLRMVSSDYQTAIKMTIVE